MANELVKRVSYRDSDHSYSLDGKRVPSVTTLLGNLSKPGLVWWSATEGAKAARNILLAKATDAREEIEQARARNDTGWWTVNPALYESLAEELYEPIRRAHNDRKQAAGKKGSAVHEAIEQLHANFWTAEPPTDPVARTSFDAFISWWTDAGFEVVSTERKIVDPSGRYAGRLDLLLADGPADDDHSHLYVADVKTSNSPYAEHILQNAGYAYAIERELEREVAGTMVLWLPEGATKLTVIERDRAEWREDFRIFESLIDLHQHRKMLDKWLKNIKETHGPGGTDA